MEEIKPTDLEDMKPEWQQSSALMALLTFSVLKVPNGHKFNLKKTSDFFAKLQLSRQVFIEGILLELSENKELQHSEKS